MIVIIGESGCGKSTLAKAFIKRHPSYKRIVTYTTRPKRAMETDGVDYYFVSEHQFHEMMLENKFVECNKYRGWWYGTTLGSIKQNEGKVVAVITPAGLRALKRNKVKLTSIYLCVDRRSRLINLLKRGDDIEEAYRRSLSDVGQFDGVDSEVDIVINNPEFILSIEEELYMLDKQIKV